MRQVQFQIDGFEGTFAGYTNGETWNGFQCPRFTKEVALQIVEMYNEDEYNKQDGLKARFDEVTDTVYFDRSNNVEESEAFEGSDIQVNGETVHIYAIGAWCWVWSKAEVA